MSTIDHYEESNISPLLAMLRAKSDRPRARGSRKVIHLDEYMDARRPIAPHLIFANELMSAYPALLTDKDFDFRMQLGYLTQFSVSQAELAHALRTSELTILSDQGKEIHFPVEAQDITALVADCITIRELATSILPSEQVAIRLRRSGISIRETRQVLEQAELCRTMLRQTVASIIEAMQKSGQDLLSPIEIEALMPIQERLAIAQEVRQELA